MNRYIVFVFIIACLVVFTTCRPKKSAKDLPIRYLYEGEIYLPLAEGLAKRPGDSVYRLRDAPPQDLIPNADDAANIAWIMLSRLYGEDIISKERNYLNIRLVNDSFWYVASFGSWIVPMIYIRKKDGKVLGYEAQKN